MWCESLIGLIAASLTFLMLIYFSRENETCVLIVSKSSLVVKGCGNNVPDISNLDLSFLQGVSCDGL